MKSLKIWHHVLAVGAADPKSGAKAKCDRPKLPFEKHQSEDRTQSGTWVVVSFNLLYDIPTSYLVVIMQLYFQGFSIVSIVCFFLSNKEWKKTSP